MSVSDLHFVEVVMLISKVLLAADIIAIIYIIVIILMDFTWL